MKTTAKRTTKVAPRTSRLLKRGAGSVELPKVKTTLEERFQQLADFKTEEKDLKEKISDLQKELLEETDEKKILVTQGTLTRKETDRWGVTEDGKLKVIRLLTQPVYNELSTISKTKIKDHLGQAGVDKLIKQKSLELTSSSKYFELRIKK